MNRAEICLKYAMDNASYRGATVLSVKNKLKGALKKLKVQNFREGRDDIKFSANGKDFMVMARGQGGDPSHIGDIVIHVTGPSGRDSTNFNAFGAEQSAIAKAVAWVQQKMG